MFPPNTLMSDQYLETVFSNTQAEGEKRLMLAVLKDAIGCYQDYSTRNRREAAEWIFSRNDDEWLISFHNVCETFDLDPGYIRKRLLRWRYHRTKVNGNRFASRN